MDISPLIEAAKAGDIDSIENLLNNGAELEKSDAYGWTALNWAAGKGHTAIVEKLIAAVADSHNSGRDQRTPYAVALAAAAAHIETAALLAQETGQAVEPTHQYCKAYPFHAFRQFPEWPNRIFGKGDSDIGYLHWDFSVTSTPQHGEALLYHGSDPAWQTFCRETLGFSVPSSLERTSQFIRQKVALEKTVHS